MKILAIETSCDDTCISIIQVKNKKSKAQTSVASAVRKKRTSSSSPTRALARGEEENLSSSPTRALARSKRTSFSFLPSPFCDDLGGKEEDLSSSPTRALARGEEEDLSSSPISFEILSNIVSSQIKLHTRYGGVYPTLAKREHQKNLPMVLKKAQSKANNPKIDLIAITKGPGLEPCLWAGINFAKELAQNWKVPIIPINHIEGHIFANWLTPISSKPKIKNASVSEAWKGRRSLLARQKSKCNLKIKKQKIEFPAICLIVSGGHTQLILMKGIGKYKILGETRDDAAGECFDKTARMLGLGYPGGPAIAAKATKYKIQDTRYKVQLPRPMIHQKNYDFSFSGLKTAVLTEVKKKKRKSKKFISAICREIQQAIIDVLLYKTLKTAKGYRVRTIILGGGVIANKELQKQFKIKIKKEIPASVLYIPSSSMCTDNATMIGIAAYFNFKKKTKNSMNASHSSASRARRKPSDAAKKDKISLSTLRSFKRSKEWKKGIYSLRSLHSLAYLENIKADANLRINT